MPYTRRFSGVNFIQDGTSVPSALKIFKTKLSPSGSMNIVSGISNAKSV